MRKLHSRFSSSVNTEQQETIIRSHDHTYANSINKSNSLINIFEKTLASSYIHISKFLNLLGTRYGPVLCTDFILCLISGTQKKKKSYSH